jgi:hypothetical protein
MPVQRLAPSNVSISLETITHMRQCEAREWIRRYRKKIGEVGSEQGRAWWEQVKGDIAKRRGKVALDSLVKQMEEERREGPV